MKKLLILIILGGIFFMSGCKYGNNNFEHLYENETELLNDLVLEENNEYYIKDDIIDSISKIYIDNEKLLVMGRVIVISEINSILPIQNVIKIDSTYAVYFPMTNEKFVILCNQYGIVENMFFLINEVPSSDYYMNINDESIKKEILQKYGYLHFKNPFILDENESKYNSPFYELVFSDGIIYHFYIENNNNSFKINSYKKINNEINKNIMNYIL